MARKNKIIAGLQDAVRFARGETERAQLRNVRVPLPLDVRAIREAQGLSQQQFAAKFGFPLSTLRNWEQGRRAPTGASRNYLLVIARQPRAVEAALRAA